MKNTKKLSLISLILAAVMALSGCSQSIDPAVVESIAQSAVASALAETSVPEIVGNTDDDTTAPSGSDEAVGSDDRGDRVHIPPEETEQASVTTALAAKVTTTKATTTKATTTKATTTKATTTKATTTKATTTKATTTKATTTKATTTKAATTTTTSSGGKVVTEKLDIDTESMFFFGKQKGKTLDGSSAGSRNPVLFNFTKKELSEGYVDAEHRAGEANSMPIETEFYGLTGKVKNNKTISIKAFNNTGKTVKITESYVEHASTLYHNTKYYKNTIRLDKYTDIDITKLCSYNTKPTTYRFVARFSTGETIYLYFFLNVDEPWLYSITPETWTREDFDRMQNHRNILLKQIAADKIVPSEQLGVIGTMYLPPSKNKDDTTIKKWVKLAKSLVTDDMSDELRLYTAMKWISNNMSYDMWSHGKGARRARFKDYSGKQDAFVTRTGRCLELANILTIFCRTYGIPAIIINSDSHTWAAVYINNKWVELDMVEATKYITPKEDVSIKEIHKGCHSDTDRITPFVLSRSEYDMKYDDIYKINYDIVDGTFYY